jgi:hypothetical protein
LLAVALIPDLLVSRGGDSVLAGRHLVSPRLTAAANKAKDNLDHRLSPQEWRQDMHFLAERMRLKHKSLFHTMSETQFK